MKFNMFLLVCVLLGYACKKDEPNIQSPSSNQTYELTEYPFGVGRVWTYKVEIHYTEGSDTTFTNYRRTYSHLIDTIISGDTCHKVLIQTKDWTTDSLCNYSYAFYKNVSTGLSMIAFEGLGSGSYMFFRTKKNKEIKISQNLFLFGVDSVIVRDSAIQLTKLPIIYNSSWRSHEYIPQANVERTWLNQEYVSLNMGSFITKKLKVKLGVNSSNQIYQYYGTKGLVKVVTSNDSLIYGNGMTGWMKSNAELVSTNF